MSGSAVTDFGMFLKLLLWIIGFWQLCVILEKRLAVGGGVAVCVVVVVVASSNERWHDAPLQS